MHALSGCDTNGYPCCKGKVTAWNVLTKSKDMETILSVFGETNASESLVIRSGTLFLLALYGQRSAANLCDARYRIFISQKSSTPLKNVPQSMLMPSSISCDPIFNA